MKELLVHISKYKTIAIIGLEKNTGKTETLNFILNSLKDKVFGVTSIGTDGESKDIVFETPKPSVEITEGWVYTTTEKYYRQKKLLSEILYISKETTPMGRLLVLRALEKGKVIISGPVNVEWMKRTIEYIKPKCDIVLIDGALSRFSQSSPFIAEAIVLSTGAAFSLDIKTIVKHTKYVYNLTKLPESEYKEFLEDKIGVWALRKDWEKLPIESGLKIEDALDKLVDAKIIYLSGSLTDRTLKHLLPFNNLKIVVRDFTKIFISQEIYQKYKPKIEVLRSANVIAITVNPYSPTGYTLNSEEVIEWLKREIPEIPIVDVRKDVR